MTPHRMLLVALVAQVAACKHRSVPPATIQPSLDPNVPYHVESLGVPVRSSRTWTSALAPNKRGGWNFITQSYELHSEAAPEWIVMDLQSGETRVTPGKAKTYANRLFTTERELRASNGRIFFPEVDNALAYYDPADETVHEVPNMVQLSAPNKTYYSATLGPDGRLYLGTESNGLPTIVEVDTDTLTSRIVGEVGSDRQGPTYAYDLLVDPPWIYVAVGERPWQLVALSSKTGKSDVLPTLGDDSFVSLEARDEGIVATLSTGLHSGAVHRDVLWCVDGKTVPVVAGEPVPFKRRHVIPGRGTVEAAPEIKALEPDSNGTGHVSWRKRGTNDAWRAHEYKVSSTSPIPIESLVALPDGTVLGNAAEYHGFFRFNPKDGKTTVYGPHGPSQGPRVVVNGQVYITGYPNGVLYQYDPAKPWTSTGKDKDDRVNPDANPKLLGGFVDAGAHYGSFLVAARGRLYFAGRRERDGRGGGVGYYDLGSKTFAGNHDNLDEFDPAGLVMLDTSDRVVYSSSLRKGAPPNATADLVIYDGNLAEVYRQEIKPGLQSTGTLYRTSEPSVVVGVISDPPALYRYDVGSKKLLAWVPLKGKLGASTQRTSDESIWVVVDSNLVRIDSRTLANIVVGRAGDMPPAAKHLTWQGPDLYFSVNEALQRIPHLGSP